jgi:hypothetical protein
MSAELLQAWVNDDVGLSRPVRSFEEDLASGYLLAELLHRHRIVPKLEGFSDKQSAAAKIENFRKLQPALVDLGVRFDSRLANAMMTKRAGVALNLVYQLKLAIESARSAGAMPALADATGGGSDAAAQLGGTRVRATRRAVSESMQAAHFEDMLKKSAQDPKELAEALALSQYNTFMAESAARLEQVAGQEAAHKAAASQQRRQLELSKMREGHRLMDDWQAEGYRKQRENVLRQKEREKAALRFELTRRDRKARSAALETARAAADQAGGIDQFEGTLKRLGSGAEADFSPADVGRMGLDSEAHLASLSASMPRATSMRGEVDSFMDRLHSRKQEEALSRKEREVRRRKVMLEQAHAQAELEEKRLQEALLTKLGRQCAEERAISERLWAAQQEAAVMRDNRQLRERQYEERRQADAADRIARERELGAAARAEYAAQLATERTRAQVAAAAAAAAAEAERYAACRAMALQLADIAEVACDVRQSAQRLLPPKPMREWLTLFTNGVGVKEDPLTVNGPADEVARAVADLEAEGLAGEPEAPSETEALLAAAELDDYLLARADWQPQALVAVALPEGAAEPPPLGPADGEQGCAITGRMVLQCLEAAAPPPKPPPKPLPGSVIKLAVLGKPFSSKSEQAQRLADQFGLNVIMPHALVHSAVAAAMAAPAGDAPLATEPDPDSVAALGRRAAAVLREGGVVPDDVVAGLVVAAIREVDPVSYSGFVLDSYPASAAQAKLLEKKLTGYAPDEAAAAKPKKSKLAPPPSDPPPAETRPPSGLDLVLRLDVSDETARGRALGRRLDPATGAVYHIKLDPPPEEPGLQERLVPLGGGSAEAQLGPALAAYAESEAALSGWLVQLDVLLAVSAEPPFESVAAEVGGAVEALLERKAKMAAEEATRARAAAAEAAAVAEAAATEAAARAEQENAEPAVDAPAADSAVAERQAETPFPPLLTAERASAVLEQWHGVEDDFVRTCSRALRSLRELRHRTLQRSAGSRLELASVLAAPDHRQEVVATAQDKFNAMPAALRHRDAGKEELHMVVEEMQEALWVLSDERRAVAEALITALHADGWLAGHALRLVLELLAVADAETNRYVRTCAVLKLYASLRAGRPVEAPLPELTQAAVPEAVSLDIAAIDFGGDAAGKRGKDGKGDKGDKGGKSKGGKDAKEAPKGGKGAPASAAGAAATLTDALSLLVRSYSDPVTAPAPPAANGAQGPPREEALVAEWSAQLAVAIEGERCKLVRRLSALSRYGCGVLGELRRQAERTQAELDGMLGAKMGKEAAAVAAVSARMRQAAEAGDTIDHALILQSEALVVDESLLVVPPPLPPPPPQNHHVEADQFSAAQLLALGLRLRECSAGELLRATALASLLEQTSACAFDAAEPPLPAAWRPLGAPAYARIAAGFASGDPPLVAWPAVVAALVPVARPSKEAIAASLESGARAVGQFELLGEEAPPMAETPVGDDEGAGGSVEEMPEHPRDDADPPVPSALAPLLLSEEQFGAARLWFEDKLEAAGTSPAALKAALWRLFGAPTGSLDLVRLLSFFCDDAAKAFLVAGFLRPPAAGVDRSSLSKLELFAVLHRDTPPSAELGPVAHTDPFCLPAIDRLWDELGLGDEEPVAHAHMARHPLGRAMLDACRAYHPKDAYGTVAALHASAQHALKM